MKLSRRHIEIVEAVYRFKQISRAALELNLSQPALSSALIKLEDLCGRRLFDRFGGHVRPTEYGKRLIELILPLERTFRRIEHLMEKFPERQQRLEIYLSLPVMDAWSEIFTETSGQTSIIERININTVSSTFDEFNDTIPNICLVDYVDCLSSTEMTFSYLPDIEYSIVSSISNHDYMADIVNYKFIRDGKFEFSSDVDIVGIDVIIENIYEKGRLSQELFFPTVNATVFHPSKCLAHSESVIKLVNSGNYIGLIPRRFAVEHDGIAVIDCKDWRLYRRVAAITPRRSLFSPDEVRTIQMLFSFIESKICPPPHCIDHNECSLGSLCRAGKKPTQWAFA